MALINKIWNRTFRKNYIEQILHPKNDKLIVYAGFKIDGEKYYRFKNDQDMRYGRYLHASKFISESQMKLTSEQMISYIDDAMAMMNGQKYHEAGVLLASMKSRARLLFEEETMYRLASAVFFPLSENINEYDYDFNQEKIKKFKTMGMDSFFLNTPIKEYFPVSSLSDEDLKDYLVQRFNQAKVLKALQSEIRSTERSRKREELLQTSHKEA